MKTIDFSKLKLLLEELKGFLKEPAQIDLLNSILTEIENLELSNVGEKKVIKDILTFRATDIVYRILFELLKHAAAGEALHMLLELLKKLGD